MRSRVPRLAIVICALASAAAVGAAPAASAGPASSSTPTWQASATRLTPSVKSAYYYQNVTYTAHVVNTAHPTQIAAGTVTFFVETVDGWTAAGTRSLSNGYSKLTLQNFNYPISDMPVRAHYNGGHYLTRSTSNVVDINSVQIPVKVLLHPTTIHKGQGIYVQAIPNPKLAGFHPPLDGLPGFFQLSEGTKDIKYAFPQTTPDGAWYKARITTVLGVGTHHLTVDFFPFNSAAAFDVYDHAPTTKFTVTVLP